MAKIDRLKVEADMLKGYIFFTLGFIMMLGAGFAKLYMHVETSGLNGMVIFGFIILLIFLKISVIMLLKYKKLQNEKLKELEKCEGGN